MKRIAFLFIAGLFAACASAGQLEVHFIDVGQGAAVLLRTAEAAVLVDAGRDGTVASYLELLEIPAIDLAIATHAHADHIGGFEFVLGTLPVERIWYNGQTHTTRTFERFIDALLASDTSYEEPIRGQQIDFADLVLTVLHPTGSAADYRGHLHDYNIVVRVEYGAFSVLLTGDAEVEAELDIIRSGLEIRSTVLKLGHHGSRTSSSLQFLQAVDPRVTVYQADFENSYGHPHPEVVVRVQDVLGAELFGTDRHGTVIITTDGLSYTVTTSLDLAPGVAVECIDINTATVDSLLRIVHVGETRAAELILLRPFGSVNDLERIAGLGGARVQEIVEQGLVCPIE